MGRRVKRTRNAETWTESQYWSCIRSALRKAFRYWKPIANCKQLARRVYKGKNKRQKWEYQCNACKKWWREKEIQVDHIIPAGSLRTGHDLKGFVERLTPEDGFQVLCLKCHKIKTEKEKERYRK